jgi:hypothetical protein
VIRFISVWSVLCSVFLSFHQENVIRNVRTSTVTSFIRGFLSRKICISYRDTERGMRQHNWLRFRRSRIRSLNFFNLLNICSRTMALIFTQLLTEMITQNLALG